MDVVDGPAPEPAARAELMLRRLRRELAHVHTPEFQAEASRQALLLRDAPEEREALDFIDAALADADWEWDADIADA